MKLDYLRQKKELIPLVLFGASVLMTLLILIKVIGFFVFSARAENLVERAIAQNDTDTKETEKYFAESKAIADGLKRNNLFAPPPPKQHPVKEVSGIFGDEVLIEGRWYKVGDTIGDAKILAIGPTSAKIDWNSAEKAFLPIDVAISETSKGSQAKKAVAKAGKADMVVVQSRRESISGREGKREPGGFSREGKRAPGKFSGEGRAGLRKAIDRMRERWPNIYEKNGKKLRAIEEKWPTMSEKKRENVGKWLEEPTKFEKTKKAKNRDKSTVPNKSGKNAG